MAGRGDLNAVDPISDDRIFMMRNDEWVKMEEPIHTDKTIAGISKTFERKINPIES